MTLAEGAAAALQGVAPPRTLEALFWVAALRTLADGRLTDPPVPELRRLVLPERLFEGLPPLSDHYAERVARLADVTDLALALGADTWLADLSNGWAKLGDVGAARAMGKIDIFLGGAGWDPDTAQLLIEDGGLAPDDPDDAAWLALGRGELGLARACIERHTARNQGVRRTWEADPEGAVRGLWYWPGLALRLSERALETALARRDARVPGGAEAAPPTETERTP